MLRTTIRMGWGKVYNAASSTTFDKYISLCAWGLKLPSHVTNKVISLDANLYVQCGPKVVKYNISINNYSSFIHMRSTWYFAFKLCRMLLPIVNRVRKKTKIWNNFRVFKSLPVNLTFVPASLGYDFALINCKNNADRNKNFWMVVYTHHFEPWNISILWASERVVNFPNNEMSRGVNVKRHQFFVRWWFIELHEKLEFE